MCIYIYIYIYVTDRIFKTGLRLDGRGRAERRRSTALPRWPGESKSLSPMTDDR